LLKPAVAVVVLACPGSPGLAAPELYPGQLDPEQDETARVIVVRGHDGDLLASVPLHGGRFAVSYRNSIYGTLADRREWTVSPDPARPVVFETLSMAATDLGERTVHVPGEPPLQLWRLVEDAEPFVVLDAEENP
jgi:hypothetical protein